MDGRLIEKIRKAPGIALITVGLLAACAPAATQTIEVHPSSPTEAINSPQPDPKISSPPSPTPIYTQNIVSDVSLLTIWTR